VPRLRDYAILKAVQKTLAELGARRERTVFVSGIGCAPGFPITCRHTDSTRSTGGRDDRHRIKLANPELDIWVSRATATASRSAESHAARAPPQRRSPDPPLQQRDLRLTKGSTRRPRGADAFTLHAAGLDREPRFAVRVRPGAGGDRRRAVDTQQGDLVALLNGPTRTRGVLLEVFQNCVVFNDGCSQLHRERRGASAQLHVEHGKAAGVRTARGAGLRLKAGHSRSSRPVGDGGAPLDAILVHDETNRTLAQLLVGLEPPDFPWRSACSTALPTSYEADVYAQARARASGKARARRPRDAARPDGLDVE